MKKSVLISLCKNGGYELNAAKAYMFWFFLSLLFTQNALRAQEIANKDSLISLLRMSAEDTSKVKLLISVGQQYEGSRPDSAIMYYEEALQLSKKLDYTRGIISYYTNVTYVYNLQGKYDTSLILNLQGLEIAKAFGAVDRIISCTNNVAASYYYMEDYNQAVDYYLQTLELLHRNRDEHKLSILYSNLANVYNESGEYDKAIMYADSSVYLGKVAGNQHGVIIGLNTKSQALINLYRYDEALESLTEGISMSKKINDSYALSTFLLNLADLYLKTGKAELTEPIFREALQLSESLDEKVGICIAYRGLGYYYLNKKDVLQAEIYTRKAMDIAHENGFLGEMQKCYLLLSDLALASGDIPDYNLLRKKSDSIEQLVMNEKTIKNIQNLEVKYRAEQKEHDIEVLNHKTKVQQLEIRKKQLMLLSLLGILFTAGLTFFFILRVNRQKQRILEQEKEIHKRRVTELEIEKQLVTSEAILKGQEEERKRLARDLHDGLGGMLSGVKFSFSQVKENLIMTPDDQNAFDRSLEMLGSSIFELRQIAHNMMPESLVKFGLDTALKDFCTEFNQSGTISVTYQSYGLEKLNAEHTTLITIYRIVQELLNNVRKHAGATIAIVQLVLNENTLSVTVEDNGKGFQSDELSQSGGIGWKNIKSRVEYLNGTWDIQSEPGKGSAINIEVKL